MRRMMLAYRDDIFISGMEVEMEMEEKRKKEKVPSYAYSNVADFIWFNDQYNGIR